MPTTWVVVASRAGARIYANHGPGKGLMLVREIPHPDGRLKGREIKTDRPGQTVDSVGAPHGFAEQVSPTEHLADLWAGEIADLLETERNENRYQRLVLAAEPGFLGRLQGKISKGTAERVVGTLNKDLGRTEPAEIAHQVAEVIAV